MQITQINTFGNNLDDRHPLDLPVDWKKLMTES